MLRIVGVFMKNVNRYIKYIIVVIIFFAFECTPNFFLPDSIFRFAFIYITGSELHDNAIAVWQVQTSISLITLTVIALITNRLDVEYYGVYLREWIQISHPKRLNYLDTIIISIIFIFLNYFNVLYCRLNSAVSVLLLNMFLIINFIYDICTLLFTPEKYKKEIETDYLKKALKSVERENEYGINN